MTGNEILIIAATAAGSGLVTVLLGFLLFRFYLRKLLIQELEEFSVVLKSRLKEAGRELLPDFRTEVREGFKEAMHAAAGGELIEKTAESLANTSTNFLETGLNILLGKPERKK